MAILGRTEETLRVTAAEVERFGVRPIISSTPTSRRSGMWSARRKESILEALGPPRVLVDNAGIAGRKAPIHETTPSEWDAVMAANLRGVFLMSRALLPAMRGGTGRRRIVTIAEASAPTLGTAGLAPYCAAKWGALGFTKALAEELRGSGMQAMAVLPGSVDTPMLKVGGFAPQMSPEDIAGLVTYAALDAPDAMNGSAIECFGP